MQLALVALTVLNFPKNRGVLNLFAALLTSPKTCLLIVYRCPA